jgi:hypothetical protein
MAITRGFTRKVQAEFIDALPGISAIIDREREKLGR